MRKVFALNLGCDGPRIFVVKIEKSAFERICSRFVPVKINFLAAICVGFSLLIAG